MFARKFRYPHIATVVLLGCAGLLAAWSTSSNAQTQMVSSSLPDNVMSSNGGGESSSQVSEHNNPQKGYAGGYVSHEWYDINHLTFEGGVGGSIPTGNGKQFMNAGWSIKLGGGYKFNDRFSLMLDYDYVSMGVPMSIVELVNPQGGGATHLWSLTINPMINYKTSGRWGGYVVGGGGFYRKVVNFTQQFGDYCAYYDPYYGCIPGVVDQTVAHFSNNAGGANFGTGFTYRLTDSGRAKMFIEGRYVWVDNQPSANSIASTGYAPTNYRTEYVPITLGVRF
jgi:hypothetical protein